MSKEIHLNDQIKSREIRAEEKKKQREWDHSTQTFNITTFFCWLLLLRTHFEIFIRFFRCINKPLLVSTFIDVRVFFLLSINVALLFVSYWCLALVELQINIKSTQSEMNVSHSSHRRVNNFRLTNSMWQTIFFFLNRQTLSKRLISKWIALFIRWCYFIVIKLTRRKHIFELEIKGKTVWPFWVFFFSLWNIILYQFYRTAYASQKFIKFNSMLWICARCWNARIPTP